MHSYVGQSWRERARDAFAGAGVAEELGDPVRELPRPANDVDLHVGSVAHLGPREQVVPALASELATDEENARRPGGGAIPTFHPVPAGKIRARPRDVHATAEA